MRSMFFLMAAFGLLLAGSPGAWSQTPVGKDDESIKADMPVLATDNYITPSGQIRSYKEDEVLVKDLIQQLKSDKLGDRFEAISALKKMGPDAKAAIPALMEVAEKDPDASLRELASGCLDVVGRPMLNDLVQQLKSGKPGDRFEAISAIRKMGPDAKAAIPALVEVAEKDPDASLRELAKGCLDVIGRPIPNPKPVGPAKRREIVIDLPAVQQPKRREIVINLKDPVAEALRKARLVVGGDLYSVVTINNETRGPLNYLYRWGNDDWQLLHLEPGKCWPHSHKYKFLNEHKSPPFEVRFDRNVGPRATWMVQRLKGKPSPKINADFGRQYDFQQSDNLHIVLHER